MIPIIGAGAAGLLTGIALAATGHEPRIYESASSVADDTGGQALLHMNPAAQAALAELGMGTRIESAGFPVSAVVLRDENGATLGTFPAAGGDYRYVSRTELFDLLLTEIRRRGVEIAFDKRLADIIADARRVSAVFADGSQVESAVLVGADGVDSTVRQAIDPRAAPGDTGQWFVHGRTDTGGDRDSGEKTVTVVRDSRTGNGFGWITTQDGATHWWLRASTPARDPAFARHDRAAQQLIDQLPPNCPGANLIRETHGELATYRAYAMPPGIRWVSGRLVLVGDAAHACSPAASQAIALAAEDAVTLARALRDDASAPDALWCYERMRAARAERAIAAGNPHRGIEPGPPFPIDWNTTITPELADTVHEQHRLPRA